MMTDVELLRHSPLLAGLTPDEAVALVEIAEVRTYADGDTLVEEGAESDCLFILKSGSLNVEKRQANGKGAVTLTTLGDPGDFFGEMSLIDSMPRSADIRASGPAEALAFPKRQLTSFFTQSPRVQMTMILNIARNLSLRLRQANSRIVELSGS
jgi:CRP-like cAMP-binding protein